MEEGIRNERFSSGARAVGRSSASPDGERFSMATKSIVLAATIATVSLVDSVRLSPALTCFLLLYLAACGQRSMAFKMLVFYAALWGACLALAYGKMTVIVFSPVHFYAAIKTYPIMVAFFAVALSPPGLISAALAKARIPKRLIVGVLVLLRFFPTVRSSFRRLSESCKRRGVLSAGNIARSPVQALEHALVPLMFSLVDSSDRLSASAIARAAEAPTRRTSYYRSPFGVADAVCLAAVATALAACVWVVRGGWFG